MTCMKGDFAKAIEVYADIVNNPTFPTEELTGEKQRILAGIEGQDADWFAQAMRFFKKSYFGPLNSPYQFTPIGQKDVVSQATSAQLQQWYQTKVIKPSRVLAIYGDIDLAQAQALATKYLAIGKVEPIKLASSMPNNESSAAAAEPSAVVERVDVQKTDQALAGIVIGYQDASVIGSPDHFPMTVADTITSGYGYPSGYLFETLRGRGLVYNVDAYDNPGRDAKLPGAFIVYAGCDPKNVNECIDLMLENIARCQGTDQDMQKDWFDRAKQLITTGDAMENETPAQQAASAALDELYGLGYDYHSHFADRINAVTIDQVRELARSELRQCIITVSTPAPELVKRDTGVRTYKSFPPIDLTPRGVQHDVGK
jgi:zinc protease